MRYNRNADLTRLLALWPRELDTDLISRTRMVARLEAAVRVERQRARDGHWLYSPARLVGLLHCLRCERQELAAKWHNDHCL